MRGPQQTLASSIALSGKGLHSGKPVNVRLCPAAAGTGFVFRRTDLEGKPEVALRCENLVEVQRRTALRANGAEVHTCEHLIAGLFGCGVDNAVIEIDSEEPPAGDGSARIYVEAVAKAGMVALDQPRAIFKVKEPIAVGDAHSAITLFPLDDAFRIEYTLDYGVAELPPARLAHLWSEAAFVGEIASARTFVLEREAVALKNAGFGKGADTSNTLVVGPEGVVGNQLRWEDEFTRHKILDVVGDLALAGCRIEGRVVAVRSGHQLNQKLAAAVRDAMDAQLLNGDLVGRPGAMDPQEILKYAPHRYPFLMVDRIIEITDNSTRVLGVKNVTFNEPYFVGHFPGQPVMPGVMQIETMAQVGGIIAVSAPENADKVGLLVSVDSAKFRRSVVPGDRLIVEAKILKSRRGLVEIHAVAKVNGELASEAMLKFLMVPKAAQKA